MEAFYCRICKQEMELPADAVLINHRRGSHYKLYKFGGQLHDLTPVVSIKHIGSLLQKIGGSGVGLHFRWHVNRRVKKDNCRFCFPKAQT